jgi:hypothetical protein
VKVKVATLKALTSFLTSIEDEEEVLKYKGMMPAILDIVINVLQEDETEGEASIQSLIELTEMCGEIWTDCLDKLLYVSGQIMKADTFEDATRQAALQIVDSLCDTDPVMVRKHADKLRTEVWPAITIMLTCLENPEDLETWAESEENDVLA